MAKVYSNQWIVSVSGGIVKCPDWYIENPDGTYMGIDINSGTFLLSIALTFLNNVKVYHQGNYYATAPLYKSADGKWWVHFTPPNQIIPAYYHIISGGCVP
jgi:hypothetical protein